MSNEARRGGNNVIDFPVNPNAEARMAEVQSARENMSQVQREVEASELFKKLRTVEDIFVLVERWNSLTSSPGFNLGHYEAYKTLQAQQSKRRDARRVEPEPPLDKPEYEDAYWMEDGWRLQLAALKDEAVVVTHYLQQVVLFFQTQYFVQVDGTEALRQLAEDLSPLTEIQSFRVPDQQAAEIIRACADKVQELGFHIYPPSSDL